MASLNAEQQKAVNLVDGPVLLLAGAGSGKTRALTFRIAHLIEDLNVDPWNIMAITFTNKAAREMRERVDRIVGFGSDSIWVATFHSSCVRILRRYIDHIGYETNFTIYDTDDSKTVMKDVCKRLNIDTKRLPEKRILNAISKAKDELRTWEDLEKEADSDDAKLIAKAFREYQETLKKSNALDFDDLIVKTVTLLQCCPEVLKVYQERFHYVMVDEYQDTNTAQFELIRLLASGRDNLCVVGDDDQSIYKFRGANIYNILNFEKHYPKAHVIRMEQNYRSTGNILKASNAVIANNTSRKGKKLWTEREEGNLVHLRIVENGLEEAEEVAREVMKRVRAGSLFRDCAILYRTNAQSRTLEERFVRENIPYTLVGGVNFYSRREIKDILAYLKTIANGTDDVATKRIINVPKRGIGQTSIARIEDYAYEHSISFFKACEMADSVPGIGKASEKVKAFAGQINEYRNQLGFLSITEMIDEILESTDYIASLKAEDEKEAEDRIQNIDEFISKAASYMEENDEAGLEDFLAEVALVADIDNVEGDDNRVVLMTCHAAKGLEFKNVFIVGLEDGLFPGSSAQVDRDELEEERRLMYVAMTRAMDDLSLYCAKGRMLRGTTQYLPASRFIREIPTECLDNRLPGSRRNDDYDDSESGSFTGSSYESGSTQARSILREKPYGGVARPKAIPRPTTPEYAKPFIAQGLGSMKAGAPQSGSIDYVVGDRVRHIKFGEGTVSAMEDCGTDVKVTVEFDEVGKRIMFAAFAKLQKID